MRGSISLLRLFYSTGFAHSVPFPHTQAIPTDHAPWRSLPMPRACALHLSTSFCTFLDLSSHMMKPALSAKNTDTTPTMTVKDDDDGTSSTHSQTLCLMDNNVR